MTLVLDIQSLYHQRVRFSHALVVSKPTTLRQGAQTTIPRNHHKVMELSRSKINGELYKDIYRLISSFCLTLPYIWGSMGVEWGFEYWMYWIHSNCNNTFEKRHFTRNLLKKITFFIEEGRKISWRPWTQLTITIQSQQYKY